MLHATVLSLLTFCPNLRRFSGCGEVRVREVLEFLAEVARCNSYCSFRSSSVKIIAACAVPRPMILGARLMEETTNESMRRPSIGIPMGERHSLNAQWRVAGHSRVRTFLFADFDWRVTKSANFGGESGCIFQVFCGWPPSGGWAAKLAILECFCCVEMHVGSDDSFIHVAEPMSRASKRHRGVHRRAGTRPTGAGDRLS